MVPVPDVVTIIIDNIQKYLGAIKYWNLKHEKHFWSKFCSYPSKVKTLKNFGLVEKDHLQYCE